MTDNIQAPAISADYLAWVWENLTMPTTELSAAVVQSAPRILQVALLLEREGKLAEVGGLAYLVECVDAAEAARQPGESVTDTARRYAQKLLDLPKLHDSVDPD